MATIFSLSNSALLITLAVMAMPARAAPVACPQTHAGARLSNVTLFDGPPSEHADLAPDVSSKRHNGERSQWDVGYIAKLGRKLFIQCEYGSSGATVLLSPTAHIRRCIYALSDSGINSLTCR